MIVVVMGVAGSGKTTVGTLLAQTLDCAFADADTQHPSANIERMRRGVPLTDADREPWLASVHAVIRAACVRGESLVVACSALKQSYRNTLSQGLPITWVYLRGAEDLIRDRLRRRTDHVLKADLLASQFEALEEPSDAIVVGISPSPEIIVSEIAAALASRRAIHVFTDPAALAWHAAEATVAVIDEAVRRRGRCSLVLSGGTTPRPLYELLATRFRDRVPWHGVHMFWGDERYVPHAHRDSNYGMAREVLLDRVPCVPGNVHPVPTHGADPAEAARDYEGVLRAFFAGGVPAFDLALLGMGPDGHTASLFPGSSALHDWTSLVRAVESAADPPLRVTMTFAALTHAAASYVLVTGFEKAAAVRQVLSGGAGVDQLPAVGLQQTAGRLFWLLDATAAARLSARPS